MKSRHNDLLQKWSRYVQKSRKDGGWCFPGEPLTTNAWIAEAASFAGSWWKDENWDRWGMDSVKYAARDCMDEFQGEELDALEFAFESALARFARDSAPALIEALNSPEGQEVNDEG